MVSTALRYIREFHNVPATKLATDLGYSKSYISEIEAGVKRINMDLIEKYSTYFDVPVSSIFILSESLVENSNDAAVQRTTKKLVRKILAWVADEE